LVYFWRIYFRATARERFNLARRWKIITNIESDGLIHLSMLAVGIDRNKREGDAETPAFQFQP
jgi:hypothetical protein